MTENSVTVTSGDTGNSTGPQLHVEATDKSDKPPATDGKDWQAEAEKWKSLSRKNEETAKANAAAAKRLEEIEAANATEQEKAIKKAVDEALTGQQSTLNARLIAAEARALAAEAQFIKPHLAVKVLDLTGVKVDDNGNVDSAEIKKLLSELASDAPELIVSTEKPRPKPDDAQGQTKTTVREATPGMDRLRAAYADTKTK